MKWLILACLLFMPLVSEGEEIDKRTDYRLWNTKNLNRLFGDNLELVPTYGNKWKYCLSHSEYCPYCGGFSYYHKIDNKGNRKCCRCGAEWKPVHSGNYWIFQKLPY